MAVTASSATYVGLPYYALPYLKRHSQQFVNNGPIQTEAFIPPVKFLTVLTGHQVLLSYLSNSTVGKKIWMILKS